MQTVRELYNYRERTFVQNKYKTQNIVNDVIGVGSD